MIVVSYVFELKNANKPIKSPNPDPIKVTKTIFVIPFNLIPIESPISAIYM